jgi:hypothetical protein
MDKMELTEMEDQGKLKVSGTSPAPDRFNRPDAAQEFSGESFIEIPDPAGPNGSISISFWMKITDRGRFRPIMSKTKAEGTKSEWRVGFGPIPDHQWGMSLWHHAWKDYLGNDTLPLNEWTLLTVTADQTIGKISLYRDAKKVGEQPYLFPFSGSKESILIGKSVNSGRGDFFKGMLDDIRIYDRVISPEEIKQLYEEKIQ